MTLLELRKEYGLSQEVISNIISVPLRTYVRYENDNSYGSALKRKAMLDSINDACEITEEKGILTIDQIMKGVHNVISTNYQGTVNLCYLFGSYAKGYATDKSDVDLCVSTDLTGLAYVGLAEGLHNELHKTIDLINLKNANSELIYEIMKDGIKIYG